MHQNNLNTFCIDLLIHNYNIRILYTVNNHMLIGNLKGYTCSHSILAEDKITTQVKWTVEFVNDSHIKNLL